MELINSVNIDALYALASKLIVLVGVMAFLVSVVTQVLKQIPGLEKRVPTQITVIVTSIILCPAAMAAMAVYYSVPIDWFYGLCVVYRVIYRVACLDGRVGTCRRTVEPVIKKS